MTAPVLFYYEQAPQGIDEDTLQLLNPFAYT